tara:strand:+ start:31 stop:369 length:339 start_codon:yes stop_codon:yes gene_type:complete
MNIQLQSELVVTDRNPENADFNNPEGASYGKVWNIAMTINGGEVYFHFVRWNDEKNANNLLQKIKKEIADGGKLNMEHWTFHHLAYGSRAYQEQGGELELMQFEREQEGRQW